MTFSPVNVSNNILKRAFTDEVSVSPMKLQKLLYFIASDYSKKTQKPLLSEPFQAWDYGPVVRSVYEEFRPFGGAEIRKFAKDAIGKSKMVNEATNDDLRCSIDLIWNHGKNLSAVHLSRITHAKGSAWYKSFRPNSNEVISDAAMREDLTYVEPLGLA